MSLWFFSAWLGLGGAPPDIRHACFLEVLQDRYTQLHIAFEESLASTSFHSHGPSPSPHGVAHLAPTPGSPGLDRPRSPYRFSSRSERYEQRVASSDAPAHSSRPRSRESHLSRELDFPSKSSSPHHSSLQSRSTSRRSSSPWRTPPPAQRRVASQRTPPPAQKRVASKRTPSPTQRCVASKGSPPPKRVAGDPGVGSTSAKRPLSRGS